MKTMRLLDLVRAPWGITPEIFETLAQFYQTTLGEKIDTRAITAKLGAAGLRGLNLSREFDVIDGVAVIPVEGVLSRHLSFFSLIFGGTSTVDIADAITAAVRDPEVSAIVLDVDSPGGEVAGTQELATHIRAAREFKPIVAHTAAMMASAAYWIGSAAERVLISGDTTLVGSIGVVATHFDQSRRLENMGVRATEIVAGKFKRAVSAIAPLTEDGRRMLQERVDALYRAFVAGVATNRGVTVEEVLERMAEGRVFVGRDAIEAGLVDDVASMSELIESLRSRAAGKPGARANVDDPTGITEETITTTEDDIVDWKALTLDALMEHRPDLVEAAGIRRVEEALSQGAAQGAKAERERILDIEAQALPGHEALISELKADGKTTGAEAAVKVLAAERQKGSNHLERLRAERIDPVPPTETVDPQPGEKSFEQLVAAEEANGSTRAQAVKKVAREHPEAHEKYIAGLKPGSTGSLAA